MINWTEILLTAIITTFFGILALLFTRYCIDPYFRFKDKLIQIEAHLSFGEYILTNSWNEKDTRKEFIEYVLEIQRGIRNDVSDLKTLYKHIPSCRISNANLPRLKEIKEIEGKFYSIANASIIYFDKNVPQNPENEVE